MRSGIEDFSRPFFAFIWPSRPQWAPPRLLPARGENGKRGSDIKKTLSPPLWIEARGGIWDVDLGACGSRLTPPCSGTAPVRQHGGRTPRIPAEGITRHTRAMAFAVARSRVQRPCRQSSPEQVPYRSFPHECENSLTSLFLLSKSNPLRWASIRFGTADRDHPHTASVLTWLKIEERQTFADRSLYAPKRLCPKGFLLCQAAAPLEISLEIRRKQTDLPRGGLRPSERPMISWRISLCLKILII